MAVVTDVFNPAKDYEAVKKLAMELTGYVGEDFDDRRFRLAISKRKTDRINRNGIILAKDGENVVGMIWGEVDLSKIGKISNFIIDGQYRGQGIGNQLIQKVIAFFETHKVGRIQANVRNLEKEGKLYEKFGFKRLFCTMQR
ncbi:MAG: GNAT family N-acetyltransferase [Candidatus Lokiarchaeota archaeon]|nr:GNAT family N-acetyltransferase [Candidatus Lokiarchaeota archaeon]